MTFDATDLALIRLLQADGRAPFETLAAKVGLSRPAVRGRVERLLQSRAIRITGYVNHLVLGLRVQGLIGIDASIGANEIALQIAAMPSVPYVALVSGRFNVLAEIWTTSIETFAAGVDILRTLPGVRSLDSMIYTALVKDHYPPVRIPQPLELDALDMRILSAMQRDGRIAYVDLAKDLAMSAAAARSRVLRLINHNVVQPTALVNPAALGQDQACSFILWLNGPVGKLSREISAIPRVFVVAATLGRGDINGMIVATERNEMLETLELIRGLPGIVRMESWNHLKVLKDDYDFAVPLGVQSRHLVDRIEDESIRLSTAE